MIITKNINSFQKYELTNFMFNCIVESISVLDKEYAEEYKTIPMEDYFHEWEQIWDENDTLIGEGLDAISDKFVLNDETRPIFEECFDIARNNALEYFNESEKRI